MIDTKLVQVPLAAHFKFSMSQFPSIDQEVKEMAKLPYTNAIGSLMYSMICSQPYIAHVVSVLSMYTANPDKLHHVKWLLRYVKGTVNVGLSFKASSSGIIQAPGYVDSDYVGDLDK